uniref:Fatty acyl-CoA reductase n=2 Tax=Clastoptera arizonana TaxID=38151 RepID=A0A1B6D6G9_9HEMI
MSRIEGADISIQDFLHEHFENTNSELQEVFANSNILLTGVSGFLGSIILEKLLRSCSEISNIFVLMRSKNGKTPVFRFKEICQSRLFERVRMENPSNFTKVTVMSYEPSKEELGLKPLDLAKIRSSVSIVIHAGITQRPDISLKDAIFTNINTTQNLLHIVKQIPTLEAFVQVSTVLCHHEEKMVEEKFYNPPLPGHILLSMVKDLPNYVFEKIAPFILCDYPTPSMLTQIVSEDILRREGRELPVALIRVPFLIASYKNPLSGWSHNIGPMRVATEAMIGYLRVFLCDPNCLVELVPVDMAANLIVSVAADLAKIRQDWVNKEIEHISSFDGKTPIYNIVSSTQRQITWGEYLLNSLEQANKVPFANMVWHPELFLTESIIIYTVLNIICQELPAFIFDAVLSILGRQANYHKKIKYLNLMCKSLSLYTLRQQRYRDNNTRALWERMSAADQNIFNFDLSVIDWNEYFYTQCRGIRVYTLGDSLDSVPFSKQTRKKYKILHYLIQLIMILIFITFILLITM